MKFLSTIDRGFDQLKDAIDSSSESKVLSGKDVFKLYDTYGFPVDLIEDIISETDYVLDMNAYEEEMLNQKNSSKKASKFKSSIGETIDLGKILEELNKNNQLLESQRLEQRTNFDLEMLEATGSCNGIENYSRYLTGRKPGEPPPTLFEYIPDNAIIFADESHVSIPQLGGMYKGDHRRKLTLAEYGFRLPSCMDNRPLKFEEWDLMRPQSIFVSATPGHRELSSTDGVFVEQIMRPTGLIDP